MMLAALIAWLPLLVVLDLADWQRRGPFRVVAKHLLYTSARACVIGALAATVLNEALGQLTRDGAWYWGFYGPWAFLGKWPWPTWIVAVLVTIQAFELLALLRLNINAGVKRADWLVLAGWMLAIWLLLFDQFVQLRWYLEFCTRAALPIWRGFLGP